MPVTGSVIGRPVASLIAVLQRPKGHCYPLVALPLCLLGLVTCVRLRLVVRAWLAAEHIEVAKHSSLVPCTLAAVPHLKQLVGEVKWIDQRLVLRAVTCRIELPVPREMDVLVVDDDGCPEIGHHDVFLPRTRKNPTSPGGRWGTRSQ